MEDFKVEDVKVIVTYEGYKGNRMFPSEPPEFEIEDANLSLLNKESYQEKSIIDIPYMLEINDFSIEINLRFEVIVQDYFFIGWNYN